MSKKLSKEEVKSPDAFLATSDRVARVLSKNSKPIFAIVTLAVIAGFIAIGVNTYNEHKESEAQSSIYQVAAQLEERQQKVEEQRLASQGEKKTVEASAAENKASAPVDFEKEYAPIVSEFQKVIDQHQGTRAAAVASLDLATFLVSHERLDEAIDVLQNASKNTAQDELLAVLTKAQLASVLSKKDQLDEAITQLKSLLDNKQAEFIHPQVTLQLGVIYEQKQEYDLARDMYRRASNEYADTQAGQTAKNYLRLLNLKNKTRQRTAQEG